jgi:hypothetical protein
MPPPLDVGRRSSVVGRCERIEDLWSRDDSSWWEHPSDGPWRAFLEGDNQQDPHRIGFTDQA